jgi:hypothetical protein
MVSRQRTLYCCRPSGKESWHHQLPGFVIQTPRPSRFAANLPLIKEISIINVCILSLKKHIVRYSCVSVTRNVLVGLSRA